MNSCDNQRNKLVGKLNNSIVNLSQSFIIEDVLSQENWIEKDNGYVYYYNNSIIDNKTFFIQIIPKVYNLKEILNKIQISQNILLEKQNNKNLYVIFSQNKPEIDIPITISVSEVKANELNNNIVGIFLDLNKFSFEEIENIINDALNKAKESGEFDGINGINGNPGNKWFSGDMAANQGTMMGLGPWISETFSDKNSNQTTVNNTDNGYSINNGIVELNDATGSSGYLSFSNEINQIIKDLSPENKGITYIADVYIEDLHSSKGNIVPNFSVFTELYKFIRYNFVSQCFEIVKSEHFFPNSETAKIEILHSVVCPWSLNQWHEFGVAFFPDKINIYFDRNLITTYNIANNMEYIIIYPQLCQLKLDNMRMCNRDYFFAKPGDFYLNPNTGEFVECLDINVPTETTSPSGVKVPPGLDVWSKPFSIKGKDGEPGRGIINTNINSSGQLNITYSDQTTQQLGKVTGPAWFSGTQVLDNLVVVAVSGAKIGDYYLNTNTGIIYKAMNSGLWENIANIKGKDGKSAYQSAVDGGYTGNELKFNEDLAQISSRMPNFQALNGTNTIKDESCFLIGNNNGLSEQPFKITWAEISNHIVTNILQNYYTEDEVNELLSKLPKFDIKVVDELPEKNPSETTIYLVKSDSQGDNLYTEYIYISNKNLAGIEDGHWEKLGEQTLSLEEYATKDYVLETIPAQTGIRYVGDYRKENMTDNQVIAAALHELQDYETLMFEYKRTYEITEPIYLTETEIINENGEKEIKYIDRIGVTFNGNYCTIGIKKGLVTADYNPFDKKAMLILSDDKPVGNPNNKHIYKTTSRENGNGNGMYMCHFTKFYFNANHYNSNLMDTTYITTFITLATPGSFYIHKTKIDYCQFNRGTGLYFAGSDTELCYNYFLNCHIGISDDGGTRDNIHDNYFYTTKSAAIKCNTTYDGIVAHNTFYKCKNYSIVIEGLQPRLMKLEAIINVTVKNNVIYGATDDETNYVGIACLGCKNAKITNNFIRSMGCQVSKDPNELWGYGIIVGGGYNNENSCRATQRAIVSENIIQNTVRSGIRVRCATETQITGNQIIGHGRHPKQDKFIYPISGIYVDTSTRIKVTNNYIANYPLNNNNQDHDGVIVVPSNTVEIVSNYNTYYSGLTFADTVKGSNPYFATVTNNNIPIDYRTNNTLVIIPGVSYPVSLIPKCVYNIWIPSKNSDSIYVMGEDGKPVLDKDNRPVQVEEIEENKEQFVYTQIYYNKNKYDIVKLNENNEYEATSVPPLGYFARFIYAPITNSEGNIIANQLQIIDENDTGGNSLWKELYSSTDIKMSTIS